MSATAPPSEPPPRPYTHDGYCEHVGEEIDRFVSVVRNADPHVRVLTCPRWTLTDLVHHTGAIHRWAAGIVTTQARRWPKIATTDDWAQHDTAAEQADWLTTGRDALLGALLGALRSADPDDRVWAWGLDPHVRFWSRRMLHETGIHRADAEIALGAVPEFATATAVDGVGEFLENLWKARAWRWNIGKLRGGGGAIRLRATDTGDEWKITLGDGAPVWTHRPAANRQTADVTVAATVANLYLLLWRRIDPASPQLRIVGNAVLLDHWHKHSAV